MYGQYPPEYYLQRATSSTVICLVLREIITDVHQSKMPISTTSNRQVRTRLEIRPTWNKALQVRPPQLFRAPRHLPNEMSTVPGASMMSEVPSAIEWQWMTTSKCGSNSAILVTQDLGTVSERRGEGCFGPLQT